MTVRARAPLRISFCGGGTDLAPYVNEHGGAVFSATIARHAHVTLRFQPAREVQAGFAGRDADAGALAFLDACLRRFGIDPAAAGVELRTAVDVPVGTGLGASSAMVVAMIGAVASWRGTALDHARIARLAWEVERRDVGIAGGLQDQYAAAFGGFNFIEFHGEDRVVVTPLEIEGETIAELQRGLLLVFTGIRRHAPDVIAAQVTAYTEQRDGVVDALDRMKELAGQARDAIAAGDLRTLGEVLHEDWEAKKRTAGAVTTARIDEMYDEARRLGVVGGKICGAGGGGFLLLCCPPRRRPAVVSRLAELGGGMFEFEFDSEGVRSWRGR